MSKIIRDGKEYASYHAYCNDPDLDTDLVYLYLSNGKRTPQNEKEEQWAKESTRIDKSGRSFEVDFN